MRPFRNPQLWLSLAKELWEGNRDLKMNQIAASLAYTTILSLVPMVTIATILIGYLPRVIQVKKRFQKLAARYLHAGRH
jgi:membrane protein